MVNFTSTSQFLLLILLISCDLVILRCALPNKANDIASNIVDLPAPFCPMTRVDLDFIKLISVQLFPVDRKFFQRMASNIIMLFPLPVLHLIVVS